MPHDAASRSRLLTPRREPLVPLAAASLALVLVVVIATAAIRLSGGELGEYLTAVRLTHRVSASVVTLLIAALGWLAWRSGRRRLAAAIVLATAFLSILGAATGVSPPPAAQAGNLLGGLALAALLAAFLGLERGATVRAWPLLPWVVLQLGLGAWLSIFAEELWSWPLVAHATLGLALSGTAAWLALRMRSVGWKAALFLCALAVPVSGAAAALLGLPLGAALAHSASVAALLVVGAAGLTHIKGGRAPS